MAPMRLDLTLTLVLALAAPACVGGGGDDAPPSASPSPTTSVTGSPSASASASPSASPTINPSPGVVKLPADAPRTVEDPEATALIAAGDLTPLAPPGALIGASDVRVATDASFDQVAFVWSRGDDPFSNEQGFVIWQRLADTSVWKAVFAFTDAPSKEVLGISLHVGDATGDGVEDILTFEAKGGSGNCGTWRVNRQGPGIAEQIFQREKCDTVISIIDAALQVREALYETGDAHCCPSAIRTATLEWDGERFVETDADVEPTT